MKSPSQSCGHRSWPVLFAFLLLVPTLTALVQVADTTAASASVQVPLCADSQSSVDLDAANCRLAQPGASMVLSTAVPDQSGIMRGRFTMTLPDPDSVCTCGGPSVRGVAAGIDTRIYQPGQARATYDNLGLNFQEEADSPSDWDRLTTGGTISGTYSYHDPGGNPGVLLVTAFTRVGDNQGTVVSVADDDEIQFGTALAPPTCAPPPPTIESATTGTVTLGVTPCADGQTGIDGYQVIAYLGGSTTPYGEIGYSGTTNVDFPGLPNGQVVSFATEAYNSAGSGPLSARSARAVPPFDSIAAFVGRQWTDFAGRAPSTAEANAWTAALNNGTQTPIGLMTSALTSEPSWQVPGQITRLYQAYFGRLPDLGGLRFWVNKRRGGATLAWVSSAFAGSSEFLRTSGALSNADFVHYIYQHILGRPGDTQGIAFWTSQLDRQVRTRGQVMTEFSESTENVRNTQPVVQVVEIYSAMIGRLPTSDEVTAGSSQSAGALIQAMFDGPDNVA